MDAFTREMRNQLRASVADADLYESELLTFFKSLVHESPRALAVVSFSYIDGKLEILMRKHLNPEITGGLDSLFEGFGPLSSASARIKTAASLWWLNPSTYKNLELIRKIRNTFAHHPFLNSFDESPIRDLMDQCIANEKPIWKAMESELQPYDLSSRRQIFHIRAALTCAFMIEELTFSPKAVRMGLPPSAFWQDGFDAVPKQFKDLIASAVSVMSFIAPKDSASSNSDSNITSS